MPPRAADGGQLAHMRQLWSSVENPSKSLLNQVVSATQFINPGPATLAEWARWRLSPL